LLVIALLLSTVRPPFEPARDVLRLEVNPPRGGVFSGPIQATVGPPQLALSPDGRMLAFVVSMAGARPLLWVRKLSDPKPYVLEGTEGAEFPFWSPGSNRIGFFAQGKLLTIPAAGGPVQRVAENIADPRGASWNRQGTILFGTGAEGLFRVSSEGGNPIPVTRLEKGDGSHRFPWFLPDGEHFLFSIRSSSEDRRGIYAGSLHGRISEKLAGGENPASTYAAGSLFFMQGDSLIARDFNAGRLALGERTLVVAQGVGAASNGYAAFSVSTSGMLAWSGPSPEAGRLTWFGPDGTQLEQAIPEPEPRDYPDFRLSDDETRLACSLVDPKSGNPQVWIAELLTNGRRTQLTAGAFNSSAIWSADDSSLIFKSTRSGGFVEFYRRSSAGGGADEPVLTQDMMRAAGQQRINTVTPDLSPDGKKLLYGTTSSSGSELWELSLEERKPQRILSSDGAVMHASYSPAGKFFVYASDEKTGKMEVFVETLPRSENRRPVSIDGGYEPRWNHDGSKIYYLSLDRKLMVASMGPNGPSRPTVLFQTQAPPGISANRRHYVPSRNGRFLINVLAGDPAPTPIAVEMNWNLEQ
jgi:Tol biopolymer transport system component